MDEVSVICILFIIIFFVAILIISGFLTISYNNLKITDDGEKYGYNLLMWSIIIGWTFSGVLLLSIIGLGCYVAKAKPDVHVISTTATIAVNGIAVYQYVVLGVFMIVFITIGILALIASGSFEAGSNSSVNSNDIHTISSIGWSSVALLLAVVVILFIKIFVGSGDGNKGTHTSNNPHH